MYISHAVSRSGDLNRYGHDFSEFLSDYAPAQSLPYLPDVARLEWLSTQVYTAKDTPTQNVSCLIETPPAQWGMLSFTLDPAHAILASSWPLARIWEVNQPGYTGDFSVDLSPIPREFLIHRTEQGIAVSQIKIGDAVLLRALATARSLDDALIQALEADALFDLTASLHLLIAHGLLRYAYRTQGNAP